MNFLIASIMLLSSHAEPLNALELDFGPGMIVQDASRIGFDQELFIGVSLEASYASKQGAAWLELGISGLLGGGVSMNSGAYDDDLRGLGLHFDASYSLLSSSYVDLKAGLGVGAKWVQREHQDNELDQNHVPHPVSRRIGNLFVGCGRGLLAINIHGKRGIGGLELRPFKMELGPRIFDFMPSLAIYVPM